MSIYGQTKDIAIESYLRLGCEIKTFDSKRVEERRAFLNYLLQGKFKGKKISRHPIKWMLTNRVRLAVTGMLGVLKLKQVSC